MKLTTTMTKTPKARNPINQYQISESNGMRAFSKNEYGSDLDTRKMWSTTKKVNVEEVKDYFPGVAATILSLNDRSLIIPSFSWYTEIKFI
jgi:hypothetical protein